MHINKVKLKAQGLHSVWLHQLYHTLHSIDICNCILHSSTTNGTPQKSICPQSTPHKLMWKIQRIFTKIFLGPDLQEILSYNMKTDLKGSQCPYQTDVLMIFSTMDIYYINKNELIIYQLKIKRVKDWQSLQGASHHNENINTLILPLT